MQRLYNDDNDNWMWAELECTGIIPETCQCQKTEGKSLGLSHYLQNKSQRVGSLLADFNKYP
jgi:uncharacterized cysteine cluster protein YcgN (CxxCxxCC family)